MSNKSLSWQVKDTLHMQTLQVQPTTESQPLIVQDYTEKSIAVFGDTKPWAANLKALGGKFNGNLRGQPGWIFQKTKQAEVAQFVAQANARMIQPNVGPTANPYQVATPQMVPANYVQPAMTPQAAFAQLSVAQPTTQLAQPRITAPKPYAQLPTQPAAVTFPNMFTAGDGLAYQVIIYTVPVPSLGQRVTLRVGSGENTTDYGYVVSAINSTAPIDDIYITQVFPEGTDPETVPSISQAIIMKGKWQIFCMQGENSLIFH